MAGTVVPIPWRNSLGPFVVIGMRPHVFVAVGTDSHLFTRLLEWSLRLEKEEWVTVSVQHGATPLPAGLEGSAFLGANELAEAMAACDVLVCHGGPGLIMEGRAHGHKPVVVPRSPELGEHVDSHQIRFTSRLAAEGLIDVPKDYPEFRESVRASMGVKSGRSQTAGVPPLEIMVRFEMLVGDAVTRRNTLNRGRRRYFRLSCG